MHFRLWVIGEAENREDFIEKVEEALESQEERFVTIHKDDCPYSGSILEDDDDVECNCDDYKKYGFWDWYIIGGRWSGVIEEIHPLHKELEVAWQATCKDAGFMGYYLPNEDTKPEFRAKLAGLVAEGKVVANEYYNPTMSYDKDQYLYEGCASDVQPLTQRIFDLISSEGVIKDTPDEWGDRNVLFTNEDTFLDHVPANYWIAVVDYHN